MVFDTALLNTQHYKVRITSKMEQSKGRGSALPCTSSWTPLKPLHSIPCWLSVQWEPSAVEKKASLKVCGWICSVWPSWVWESQHASTGNSVSWSLGHSSRSSFHRRSPEHQESELISSTISLLSWQRLSFWYSLSTLGTNFAQIFSIFSSSRINKCVYSSHTYIKLCTYCLYRHTRALIHEILYLANQLWCSDFLTPPTPLIIPQRLPAFPLKNWCLIHARWTKISLKHSIHFCGIFSKFKT